MADVRRPRIPCCAAHLVGVVHGERHAGVLKVVDVADELLAAVRRREGELEDALARHDEVGRLVLVAVGVAADDDRLGPARHEARDRRDQDRLAEHGAAEDVADRAVRARPHLLEVVLWGR